MIKYSLTKLNEPGDGCWYEIPVDQVKTLFEDPDFNGEIALYTAHWQELVDKFYEMERSNYESY